MPVDVKFLEPLGLNPRQHDLRCKYLTIHWLALPPPGNGLKRDQDSLKNIKWLNLRLAGKKRNKLEFSDLTNSKIFDKKFEHLSEAVQFCPLLCCNCNGPLISDQVSCFWFPNSTIIPAVKGKISLFLSNTMPINSSIVKVSIQSNTFMQLLPILSMFAKLL